MPGLFAKRCREAKLEKGLSSHGIRKFGATRAADMGATEHQLMALFGWSSTKQAGVYTKKANRVKLEAVAALSLLRQAELNPARSVNRKAAISGKSAPDFPVVEPSGTIRAKKT
jgi:hypothetical protein